MLRLCSIRDEGFRRQCRGETPGLSRGELVPIPPIKHASERWCPPLACYLLVNL